MKEILQKLLNHEFLTREEMKRILIGITMSEFPNEQITATDHRPVDSPPDARSDRRRTSWFP